MLLKQPSIKRWTTNIFSLDWTSFLHIFQKPSNLFVLILCKSTKTRGCVKLLCLILFRTSMTFKDIHYQHLYVPIGKKPNVFFLSVTMVNEHFGPRSRRCYTLYIIWLHLVINRNVITCLTRFNIYKDIILKWESKPLINIQLLKTHPIYSQPHFLILPYKIYIHDNP